MREREPTEWVVYRTASRATGDGQSAICSQQEWNAMEAATPGVHVLVKEHIGNEATAERLARSLIVPAPVKVSSRVNRPRPKPPTPLPPLVVEEPATADPVS